MIGLPPTAGFISKWQLGLGALESPHPWVLVVLVLSSLLNAAYFLPVVWLIWFGEDQEIDDDAVHSDSDDGATTEATTTKVKEPAMLLVPAVCTAVFTLAVGIAASLAFAPLEVARFIAEGVFS